jgi:hypothetical protein
MFEVLTTYLTLQPIYSVDIEAIGLITLGIACIGIVLALIFSD